MVQLPALALQPFDISKPINNAMQLAALSQGMKGRQEDRELRRLALGQQAAAQKRALGKESLDMLAKATRYVRQAPDEAGQRQRFDEVIGELARQGYAVDGADFSKLPFYESMIEREQAALMSVAPGGTVIDKNTGQPVFQAPERPEKPNFGQPVAGIGPDGKPAYMQFDRSGNARPVGGLQPLPRTGMEVETKDGTVVRIGGEPGASGLAKPTVNEVEKSLLNATERMARVDAITRAFKPEYQQLGTRWSAMATAAKEKAGFQPDPNDQAALAEFSTFKARAAGDLSQTLKEMSGAAVTPQEAERLLKTIPNPGTGLFDGDSPTEFQAKMNDVARDVRRAIARLSYIRTNGFDMKAMGSIPLDSVPKLIQQRGEELLKQGMSAEEAKAQLAREFGLAQ